MAMGAIVGTGSVAASETGLGKMIGLESEGTIKKHRDYQSKIKKAVSEINAAQADLTTMDIYEKTADVDIDAAIEDGQYIIYRNGEKQDPTTKEEYDKIKEQAGIEGEEGSGTISGKIDMSKGAPMLNPEKVNRMLGDMRKTLILNELFNALHTEKEKNALAIKYIRSEMLSNLALKHFEAGLGDLLQANLANYKKVSEEELAALGYTKEGTTEQDIDNQIRHVQELERLYNDVQEAVVVTQNKYEKSAQQRKHYLFDKGQRILAIDNVLMDMLSDTQKFMISPMSEVLDKLVEEAGETGKAPNLFKHRQRLDRVSSLMDQYTRNRPGGDPRKNDKLGKDLEEAIYDFLTKFMEDADLKNNLSISRDFFSTSKNLLGIANILEQRKTLFEDWEKVASFSSGEKYFQDNKGRLTSTKTEWQKLLNLTSKTTFAQYKTYENDMAHRKKLVNSINLAERKYWSVAWREHLAEEGSTMESLIELLINNEAMLDEESYLEIADMVNEMYSASLDLETRRDTIREKLSILSQEMDLADEYGGGRTPEQKRKMLNLQKDLADVEAEIEALEKQ